MQLYGGTMKNFLFLVELSTVSTIACFATILSASAAQACDPDPYLGTMCYTAADFCPKGYSKADGQELAITSNQALFSLIGNYYGGDSRTTFALPDLRGREAIGAGTGVGLSTFNFGQTSSMTQYTMTMLNMPAHSHTVDLSKGTFGNVQVEVSSSTADLIDPAGKSFGASPKETYANTADGAMGSDVVNLSATMPATQTGTTPSNGQSPISTIQPQTALTACIATVGIYPPRP